MQLDALLRSLPKDVYVIVIYKADDEFFQKGYNKIIAEKNPGKWNTIFIRENIANVKTLLENYIDYGIHDKICFMVDDIIVYDRNFPEIELGEDECYSLRLHEGIKNKKHLDYTMSLDGNVYRLKDIKPLIESLPDYQDLNQLESMLHGRYAKQFKMKYGDGYLIGFNHNRVSLTSHCYYTGEFTEKRLNKGFLEGFIIDIDKMNVGPTGDVHTSLKYEFKKR